MVLVVGWVFFKPWVKACGFRVFGENVTGWKTLAHSFASLPFHCLLIFKNVSLHRGKGRFPTIPPLFCGVCSASCQHSFLPESEQERGGRCLSSSAASTVILVFSLQGPVTSVPCRSHPRPSLRPSLDVTFHSNLKTALESSAITVFLNHIHFPNSTSATHVGLDLCCAVQQTPSQWDENSLHECCDHSTYCYFPEQKHCLSVPFQ